MYVSYLFESFENTKNILYSAQHMHYLVCSTKPFLRAVQYLCIICMPVGCCGQISEPLCQGLLQETSGCPEGQTWDEWDQIQITNQTFSVPQQALVFHNTKHPWPKREHFCLVITIFINILFIAVIPVYCPCAFYMSCLRALSDTYRKIHACRY